MIATEELRFLLNERGVEYRFNDATKVFEWHFDGTDGEGSAHATEVNGGINIIACSLTPEQAIAATLGTETCHDKNGFDPETGFECTVCGTMVERYMVTPADTGHEVQFNFCPNCGRRLV